MSTSLNIFEKELHAVVVIDRQEFVIVLLADFVADDLPVDDGGHPVLALSLCRMDGYLAYFHFAPMTSFPYTSPGSR